MREEGDSIESQGVGGVGQKSEHECGHARGLELHVFEEALQAPIARVDLGSPRKDGGELGQIDGFGPESKPAPNPVSSTGRL